MTQRKSTKAPRSRGWSIVGAAITRDVIHAFIAEHPSLRVVGAVHDDPRERQAHGHIFFRDTKDTSRPKSTVLRLFPKHLRDQISAKPYVAHPGESGPDRGKHAMARAARYLTHEHPDQIAKGKVRYPDAAIIASPDFAWREAVDDLNAYERVRPDQPATPRDILDSVKKRVLLGELTTEDVFEQYIDVYVKNAPATWETLEEQGKRARRRIERKNALIDEAKSESPFYAVAIGATGTAEERIEKIVDFKTKWQKQLPPFKNGRPRNMNREMCDKANRLENDAAIDPLKIKKIEQDSSPSTEDLAQALDLRKKWEPYPDLVTLPDLPAPSDELKQALSADADIAHQYIKLYQQQSRTEDAEAIFNVIEE